MKSPARAWALALTASWSLAAQAHGDLERLGPFYAGALHPLLVPAHVVALLALGLLIGQRGLKPGRHALTLLLLALAVALAGVHAAAAAPGQAWAGALERSLLVVGALAALASVTALPLPRAVPAALAVAVGLGIGLGSAPEATTVVSSGSLRPSWAAWSAAAGTLLGAFVTAALVAAVVDSAPRWARVATRVAASWLSASALLVLALGFVDRSPAALPGELQAMGSAGSSSATTRPQDQ